MLVWSYTALFDFTNISILGGSVVYKQTTKWLTKYRRDPQPVFQITSAFEDNARILHARPSSNLVILVIGKSPKGWLILFISGSQPQLLTNYLVGGLEHQFYFPIYWVSNHPNWRTHIFQRGQTTNQLFKIETVLVKAHVHQIPPQILHRAVFVAGEPAEVDVLGYFTQVAARRKPRKRTAPTRCEILGVGWGDAARNTMWYYVVCWFMLLYASLFAGLLVCVVYQGNDIPLQ